MRIGTAIAIYFVIWWVVLFAVLPLKVRTQGEVGEVVPGTHASAPARPQLLLKAAMTTVLAAIVFAALWALLHSGLGLDDIPFLPKYGANR
jgi:predicted secreted protein